MIIAFVILFIYLFLIWLVFFKLKVATFNMIWGLVSAFVGVHLLLVFLIGMRFSAPYTDDARIIRHTIQIVPRLPEPTLLTEVVVQANVPVKKGDPLFRFDDRLYRYRVNELEAQLAAAKQNVKVLEANVAAVTQSIETAKADVEFAQQQLERYTALVKRGAGREEQVQEWQEKISIANSTVLEQQAQLRKAQLQFDSNIGGVNTSVAQIDAKLAQAKYYLNQTTIYAPEDGFITNLQAQPGLVVGERRIGAIASFVVKRDPYLLGTYFQEHLKFVKPEQPVEIALDMYPGQIFTGKVENIWWATGQGQLLPSGNLPTFEQPLPKGKFAIKIHLDDPEKLNLPVGAQGAAAIYTDVGKKFAPLRRVVIRTYSWTNWLYPLPF